MRSDKAVASFERNQREELNELFQNKVGSLNTSSLAAVCLTDQSTVDLMIQEFVARLAESAKTNTLKINLKVGILSMKQGGLTQFTQPNKLVMDLPNDIETASSKVSVMTPSIAQTSAKSMMTNTMHISNPNPHG